jgi:hypothetical protein
MQCPVQGTVFEVCNDVIVRRDVCRAMHTSCFHNYTLEWGGTQLAVLNWALVVAMEMEVIFVYGLAFERIRNNSLFKCELVYTDRLTDRRTAGKYMH